MCGNNSSSVEWIRSHHSWLPQTSYINVTSPSSDLLLCTLLYMYSLHVQQTNTRLFPTGVVIHLLLRKYDECLHHKVYILIHYASMYTAISIVERCSDTVSHYPGVGVFSLLYALPATHNKFNTVRQHFSGGLSSYTCLSSVLGGAILGMGITLSGSVSDLIQLIHYMIFLWWDTSWPTTLTRCGWEYLLNQHSNTSGRVQRRSEF